MVRWADDLQIPLKIKQKHPGRTVMALRGVDDSVNGHLYVTESVPAVPCLISLFYIKPQRISHVY